MTTHPASLHSRRAIGPLVRDALYGLDHCLIRLLGAERVGRPAVVGLVFHNVFESKAEIDRDIALPMERATPGDIGILIDFLLERDYHFVTCSELLGTLNPSKNYALLTFDDGYAGTLSALPVLKEYGVSATIFVSTNFVAEGRAFWWDKIYRERRRRGRSVNEISRELATLYSLKTDGIEAYLAAEFGSQFLAPVGDSDRPMTPDELRAAATEPCLEIGNHTADHALLYAHDTEYVAEQISQAQTYIETLTGILPRAIAYPFGGFNDMVVETAGEQGLDIGMTCRPIRNRHPLNPTSLLELGRFESFVDERFEQRTRSCQLDFSFARLGRNFRDRWLPS